MKSKREIHMIDYAVVEFVSALDHLFRFAINPLELQIVGGLDVETESCSSLEVRIRIRPVSWPTTSQIYARFQKNRREGEGSWKAFEGILLARHLPREFSEFAFECQWDLNGYYRFRGRGTGDEALLKRLHTARAATELNLQHLMD